VVVWVTNRSKKGGVLRLAKAGTLVAAIVATNTKFTETVQGNPPQTIRDVEVLPSGFVLAVLHLYCAAIRFLNLITTEARKGNDFSLGRGRLLPPLRGKVFLCARR